MDRNGESGFPPAYHYLCFGCKSVLVQPKQDCCGRRRCYHCVEEILSERPAIQCSDCGKVFKSNTFHRDKAAENMEMMCLNEGCDWTGTVGTLPAHLDSCRFKMLKCSGCNVLKRQEEIKEHRRSCLKLHLFDGTCFKSTRSGSQEVVQLQPSQYADSIAAKFREFSSLRSMGERIKNDLKADATKAVSSFIQTIYRDMGSYCHGMDQIENSPKNGILLWKIPKFSVRRQEAFNGTCPSICSIPFYTFEKGYKMCLRMYINGTQDGLNSHISLCLVVMKGEYDDLLKWPSHFEIEFTLFNMEDGEDVYAVFRTGQAVNKPGSYESMAEVGYSRFVAQKKLINYKSDYIIDNDDMIFIKCQAKVI